MVNRVSIAKYGGENVPTSKSNSPVDKMAVRELKRTKKER